VKTYKNNDNFWGLINCSTNIILVGHLNADGDCIGCMTGMYHFLKQIGKKAQAIIPNSFPDYLSFLDPEEDPIAIYNRQTAFCEDKFRNADLLICLDLNSPKRCDIMEKTITDLQIPKVLIDHHLDPEIDSFDVVISDTEVSSACELLLSILLELPPISWNINNVCPACANALAAGILTDTNNFANSVYPATLELFSSLLNRGIDRDYLYDMLFCSYSMERMRLMGHLLCNNMKFLKGGTVAFMTLSLEDKAKFDFKTGDSEGFVNLPLFVNNLKMSAFFNEDDGFVKVSLRSKGDVDVNKFCQQYFNGGGHFHASGGRIFLPLSEIEDYFTNCVEDFL